MHLRVAIYFQKAYIAGSVNAADYFFSGLELKVTEKIRLKIREGVQTTNIEVTTSSSEVAREDDFSFTQTNDEDETEEQTRERKEQSRIKSTVWVVYQEPSSMKPRIQEFIKVNGSTASYFLNGMKTNARKIMTLILS